MVRSNGYKKFLQTPKVIPIIAKPISIYSAINKIGCTSKKKKNWGSQNY